MRGAIERRGKRYSALHLFGRTIKKEEKKEKEREERERRRKRREKRGREEGEGERREREKDRMMRRETNGVQRKDFVSTENRVSLYRPYYLDEFRERESDGLACERSEDRR